MYKRIQRQETTLLAAAADIRAQDVGFTARLVAALDCIMRGAGKVTNLVSTPPLMLPLHIDEVLVISDKCTTQVPFTGKYIM